MCEQYPFFFFFVFDHFYFNIRLNKHMHLLLCYFSCFPVEEREAREGGDICIITADWHCCMAETNTTS